MTIDLITTKEACAICGFCRRTLYRMMETPDFPKPEFIDKERGGKPLRFDRVKISNWAMSNNPKNKALIRKKEIAEIVNLSTGRVTVLARDKSFPNHIIKKGSMKWYKLEDIIQWFMQKRPKKKVQWPIDDNGEYFLSHVSINSSENDSSLLGHPNDQIGRGSRSTVFIDSHEDNL